MKRRIYISMPADEWLSVKQNELKWAVVDQIKSLGYIPEIFSIGHKYIKGSIAAPKSWSPDEAFSIARKCDGAVIIGLPRWTTKSGKEKILFASDFCQYEGALFKTLKIPVLILAQNDIYKRGVFNDNYGTTIGYFSARDNANWIYTSNFMSVFDYFKNDLHKRRDVFLGYCSSSLATAKKIKEHLEEKGVTVKDWKKDFAPGESILQQIAKAVETCSAGIFLFTKDDKISGSGTARKAVPRDNVVFEAGYFINAKEKNRVLIVLEKGAKIPADLGGDIYASLTNKLNINPIKSVVDKFIDNL